MCWLDINHENSQAEALLSGWEARIKQEWHEDVKHTLSNQLRLTEYSLHLERSFCPRRGHQNILRTFFWEKSALTLRSDVTKYQLIKLQYWSCAELFCGQLLPEETMSVRCELIHLHPNSHSLRFKAKQHYCFGSSEKKKTNTRRKVGDGNRQCRPTTNQHAHTDMKHDGAREKGKKRQKVFPTSEHCCSHYSPCNIPVIEQTVSHSDRQAAGSRMWNCGCTGLLSGYQRAGSSSSNRVVLCAHTNTPLHAARQQRHRSLGSNIPPIQPELIKPFSPSAAAALPSSLSNSHVRLVNARSLTLSPSFCVCSVSYLPCFTAQQLLFFLSSTSFLLYIIQWITM